MGGFFCSASASQIVSSFRFKVFYIRFAIVQFYTTALSILL